MTFVGLDLHKRYITACALDASGAVLAEVRQMAVSLEALAGFLSALPAPVTVALESCLYWQWLHDQLDAQGHTVRVADPRQVKVIWQARSKTDPIDARKLAELVRVNLLPTIWIPDADTRRRRQLLHGRAFLVRQRTMVKNRIHGRLTAENLLFPRSDLYGRAAARGWPRRPCRRYSGARRIGCSASTTRSPSRSSSSTTRSSDSAAITR